MTLRILNRNGEGMNFSLQEAAATSIVEGTIKEGLIQKDPGWDNLCYYSL